MNIKRDEFPSIILLNYIKSQFFNRFAAQGTTVIAQINPRYNALAMKIMLGVTCKL